MRKMGRLLFGLILIFTIDGYGQTCKVEFYLLKSEIRSFESYVSIAHFLSEDTISVVSNFLVTRDNLEDTPIVTNDEIVSFSIRKDTLIFIQPDVWFYDEESKSNYHPNVKKVREQFVFNVSKAVVDRINKLEIPLCCGRQFALLVNDNIVYGGYFWNLLSSFGCNGIVSFAFNEEITIEKKLLQFSYESDIDETTDLKLKNPILFECLKSTGRMKNND